MNESIYDAPSRIKSCQWARRVSLMSKLYACCLVAPPKISSQNSHCMQCIVDPKWYKSHAEYSFEKKKYIFPWGQKCSACAMYLHTRDAMYLHCIDACGGVRDHVACCDRNEMRWPCFENCPTEGSTFSWCIINQMKPTASLLNPAMHAM